MIEVDGAYGEGGGQLLRTAVALSAVISMPVRVVRIREGRPNPGLAAQHVTAVRAVAAMCAAEVEGLDVGSGEIRFRPGRIAGGRHTFDVGTAGSVTLVLQACLPVALAAPASVQLKLVGGTDVRWSPPIDYVSKVFLPLLRRCGGHANVLLARRGYYPRGGGIVEVTIEPNRARSPLVLDDPGSLRSIRGVAHASHLPEDIPKRMKHAALRRLVRGVDAKVEERTYAGDEAVGQGGALVLWAETDRTILGATSLAEKGKPSERVGEEAARALVAELEARATLDIHAADQLLVHLAHADARSHFWVREVSGHLRTMAWLLPQFLPCRIEFTPEGRRTKVDVTPGGA